MGFDVRESIYEYIKGKLDNNSFEQEFDLGLDIRIDPERLALYQVHKNFQDSEIGTDFIEYTPAGIIMEETPSGEKGLDKSEWNISLLVWLTGTDDSDNNFQNQKKALNELRKELNDNSRFRVTVDTDTYECKSIATSISKLEEINPLAGYKRIVMSMGITIISGIGLKFGEDEVYTLSRSLGDSSDFSAVVLDDISKNSAKSVEYNTSQPKGQETAKGVPNRALWQSTVSITYNNELLSHRYLYDLGIGNETNSNFDDILDLEITQPYYVDGGDKITKKVNAGVSISSVTGVPIVLTITFTEATLDA